MSAKGTGSSARQLGVCIRLCLYVQRWSQKRKCRSIRSPQAHQTLKRSKHQPDEAQQGMDTEGFLCTRTLKPRNAFWPPLPSTRAQNHCGYFPAMLAPEGGMWNDEVGGGGVGEDNFVHYVSFYDAYLTLREMFESALSGRTRWASQKGGCRANGTSL
jgi:hypothetical protein